MIKIGVLTNKTRAKQRPPLIVRPASAALLAEISRMAIKPAALRGSRGKQTGKKSSGPAKPNPDTRSQPARSQPQNSGRPNLQARNPANTSSGFSSPRPQNGKPAGNNPTPEKRPGSYNGRDQGTQRPTPPKPANGQPGDNPPRPYQAGPNYRSNGTPANSNPGKTNFNRPNPAENQRGGQPSTNGKWNSGSTRMGDERNGKPGNSPAAGSSNLNGKPNGGPAAPNSVSNGKSTQGPAANNSVSNGRPTSGPAANNSASNGRPTLGPATNGSALSGKAGSDPKNLIGQSRLERKPPEARSQGLDRASSRPTPPANRPESETAKEPQKGLIQDPAPRDLKAQEEQVAPKQLPEFEDLAVEPVPQEVAAQEVAAQEQENVQDKSFEDKNEAAEASSVDADSIEASFEPADFEDTTDEPGKPEKTDLPERNDQPDRTTGTPSNTSEAKSPTANEKPRSPGNIGRSSLFRPEVFDRMTTFRVPSKMEPPRAEPPKADLPRSKPWNEPPHSDSTRVDRPIQIPMEVHLPSQNGQNGSSHNGNGKSKPGYTPEQPAAPRSSGNLGGRPDDLRTALQRFLEQQKDLPEQIAVLGVGEDGLPVLFDLHDPTPGAVVTISDERQAELEVLRTAIASLTMRGSARSVQFLVFSVEPEKWRTWINEQGFERHCLAVVGAEDDSIREWTLRLADWTEQRRLGQRGGPPVLLVMDTLNFLTRLPYDVRLNFEWMAKEGPQAQIWPLAAISSELAKSLSQRRLLRAFPMRIFGCLEDPADYVELANLDEAAAEDFGRSGEFAVRLGEHWLRFHLLGRQ